MNYWENAGSLKARATTHTIEMAQKHRAAIEKCIESAQVHEAGAFLPTPRDSSKQTVVSFVSTDSVAMIEAANNVCKGRVCVLDFADYMHPGGKFMEGSSAQEESLCHSSFLYNVLKSERVKSMFYYKHKGLSNKCLYGDELLYIPGVLFLDAVECDVIVCAAPNKRAAMRYNGVPAGVVDKAMAERCRAVLQGAAFHGVDSLILGAFGCGVFGNDPMIVAETFRGLIDGPFNGCFGSIIFAVPGSDANADIFRKVFR